MKTLSIRIDEETSRKLKSRSNRVAQPLSKVCRDLLALAIENDFDRLETIHKELRSQSRVLNQICVTSSETQALLTKLIHGLSEMAEGGEV